MCSLQATIRTVRKSKSVLNFVNGLQNIDSHEIVVVAVIVNNWEVSVLLAHDLPTTRFGVSEAEFVGKLVLQHMSEDT